MKITPLFDNVLIEPENAEETTASGIILPDSAKEKPQRGVVVACGKGKFVGDDFVKMDEHIIPGVHVMYKKWGGTEVKIDGKTLMLVSQDDILAIIE
jgi:chaperonin GroES